MKRLVLFSKQYPYGGAETYLHYEMPYLLKAFDDIVVVPVDRYGPADEAHRIPADWDNVRVVDVNQQPAHWSLLGRVLREVRALRWWGTEVLFGRDANRHLRNLRHCFSRLRQTQAQAKTLDVLAQAEGWTPKDTLFYNYWNHYGVLVGRCFKEREGYQVVARAHSIDMYHGDWAFNQLFLPFETLKLRTLNSLYAASEHGHAFVTRTFRSQANKVVFRALGVWDGGAIEERPSTDEVLFVSATAATVAKRLERIPALLSRLRGKVRWVHFGGGKPESLEALQAAIQAHGLGDQVELRGHTPNEEVLAFYRTHAPAMYLNVSQAETIPVAVMEPMSYGIPVLGTAVYGTPEIIDHGKNGLLLPLDFDLDQAAAALQAVLDDPETLARMGQAARETFEARFDADKNFRIFSRELAARLPDQQNVR